MSSATNVVERANPRSLPQPLTAICAALAVLGVVAFGWGLATDPQVAWLAFHTNFIYFATLSQAALVLSCIFVIVGAKWPGPLRRIAEGLGAWVPVTFVLAIVSWLGGSGEYLFEWLRDGAMPGKEPWLNATRVYGSDLTVLLVLALLSVAFLKASVRPTLGGAAERASGFGKTMIERWSANWKGDDAEREASLVRTKRLAPVICLLFAFGYSLLVFDQVMSMEQSWFSNLFGAYVSWGGILAAVAAVALISSLSANSAGLDGQITKARLHDIGKMLFAFSIFWMYLFFSQYLVIWYGNLPEETLFFRDRLGPQFVIDKGFTQQAFDLSWTDWNFKWARLGEAYGWPSMIAWTCCWIVPFWVLLGQRPKMTTWILGPVAAIVLVGIWFERNILIWPSVIKGDSWSFVGGIQIGVGLGFLGAFLLVFLVYTRIFPSLAIAER